MIAVAIAAWNTRPSRFSSALASAAPWIFCSTRGTTTMNVGRISARVATTFVGSDRCATRIPTPTARTCRARARMWDSGRKMIVLACSFTKEEYAAATCSASRTRFPCVMSTPLAARVVPEVYTMVATVSGPAIARRSVTTSSPTSEPRATSAARSSPGWASMRKIPRVATSAWSWAVRMTSRSASPPTRATTGAASATIAVAWVTDAVGYTGTTTAPAYQQAKSATAHS